MWRQVFRLVGEDRNEKGTQGGKVCKRGGNRTSCKSGPADAVEASEEGKVGCVCKLPTMTSKKSNLVQIRLPKKLSALYVD